MVSQSLPAGIGTLGAGKACFFHPSERIREQWPNDNKCKLTNVLVIGEGKRIGNRKEQWCYIVCIPEIYNGSEFHIVKFNSVTAKSCYGGAKHQNPVGFYSRNSTKVLYNTNTTITNIAPRSAWDLWICPIGRA